MFKDKKLRDAVVNVGGGILAFIVGVGIVKSNMNPVLKFLGAGVMIERFCKLTDGDAEYMIENL